MPIQFYDLGIVDCWGDGDSSFINDLEFYTSSPSQSITSTLSSSSSFSPDTTIMMGGSSALLIPGNNIWKRIDNFDDEVLLSMSPPNPLDFDELTLDDWESDELIVSPLTSPSSSIISSRSSSSDYYGSGIIIHDCMWAGHCLDSEHEPRTFSRQSCNSTSSSNNNNNSDSVVTNNNVNGNNSNRTGPCTQNNSSCSNNNNSNSVVKTIEVPSVCGPVRRTGVIVQKTVGRSLLIKSRTKSENNSTNNNNSLSNSGISCCNNNNNNNKNSVSCSNNNSSILNNSNSCSSLITKTNNSVINSNFLNNSNFSIPTPPVTNSRPETPQSLSESEDDSCQLDLNTVFFNIDNIKPPQGDLWDDVLAAVEQEHANGIEIPINNDTTNIISKLSADFDDGDSSSSISSISSTLYSRSGKVAPIDPSLFTNSNNNDTLNSSKTSNNFSNFHIGKKPLQNCPTTTGVNSEIAAAATTVVSDHSYDKRSWSRLEDLGIQTPSDSEEEIDVVSLFERSRSVSRSSNASSNSGSTTALPTNPSAKDQEEIQVITTSKLLSASRAVSRRLRTKGTSSRSKPYHHIGKRRTSECEEYKTTKLNKKPRIYYKPAKSRFATDSESDSKEKRDMHNNMERMRRIDLRNSFEELRALVPSLANKERAPKVVILQDAAGYCTDLKIQSRQLASQVTALRKEQERLRATVSGLRRSLAAHR